MEAFLSKTSEGAYEAVLALKKWAGLYLMPSCAAIFQPQVHRSHPNSEIKLVCARVPTWGTVQFSSYAIAVWADTS